MHPSSSSRIPSGGHGENRASSRRLPRLQGPAFTLLELLVVLAIIGILAAISLPAMKGIGKSNTMANANRQLLDDINLARQYAIKDQTTVYIIFVPPDFTGMTFAPGNSPQAQRDQRVAKRLMSGPYTTYALFADRTVGDQPGQRHFRYLTSWKTLPDGVFIAASEFNILNGPAWDTALNDPDTRPLKYSPLVFPTVNGQTNLVPHITFDSQGSVVVLNSNLKRFMSDEVITLARGSILYNRDPANGNLLSFDVRESPPGNSVDNPNRIRIDGFTGRARLERLEIQ